MEDEWDLEAKTLDKRYREALAFLAAQIEGHARRRDRFKPWSILIRFAALSSAGAGILLPLLFGENRPFPGDGIVWGYIAFAVGATILLADQVFAISSSWSRLRLSELQLIGTRLDLEAEWGKQRPLLNAASDKTVHAHALLDLLREAMGKAHLINETQAKSWMSELAEGRAALGNKVGAR